MAPPLMRVSTVSAQTNGIFVCKSSAPAADCIGSAAVPWRVMEGHHGKACFLEATPKGIAHKRADTDCF